ncbi:MAG: hypothetical protein WCJ58_02125 [bacterium]
MDKFISSEIANVAQDHQLSLFVPFGVSLIDYNRKYRLAEKMREQKNLKVHQAQLESIKDTMQTTQYRMKLESLQRIARSLHEKWEDDEQVRVQIQENIEVQIDSYYKRLMSGHLSLVEIEQIKNEKFAVDYKLEEIKYSNTANNGVLWLGGNQKANKVSIAPGAYLFPHVGHGVSSSLASIHGADLSVVVPVHDVTQKLNGDTNSLRERQIAVAQRLGKVCIFDTSAQAEKPLDHPRSDWENAYDIAKCTGATTIEVLRGPDWLPNKNIPGSIERIISSLGPGGQSCNIVASYVVDGGTSAEDIRAAMKIVSKLQNDQKYKNTKIRIYLVPTLEQIRGSKIEKVDVTEPSQTYITRNPRSSRLRYHTILLLKLIQDM